MAPGRGVPRRRHADRPSSGEVIDPVTLVPGLLPLPSESDDGALAGEVLWIDRFGNCQLNLDPDMLRARDLGPGAGFEVPHRRGLAAGSAGSSTFADAKPSELVVLVDSYGLLTLALDRQSAASAAQAAGRQWGHAAAAGCGRARAGARERVVRRGTSLVLAALLVLILLASLLQFFVQAR